MANPRYDDMADNPDWRVIERSSLEGGVVLRRVIKHAKRKKSESSKLMMFSCIRDSIFIVPCEVGSGLPRIDPGSISKGDVITLEEDVRFKPAHLVTGNGDKLLPMFSSNDRLGDNFDDCPLRLSMSFDDCVDMAKKSGMDLIIDAFMDQVVIPIDLAEMVLTIPTRIKD